MLTRKDYSLVSSALRTAADKVDTMRVMSDALPRHAMAELAVLLKSLGATCDFSVRFIARMMLVETERDKVAQCEDEVCHDEVHDDVANSVPT